jgi:hypothetical protein
MQLPCSAPEPTRTSVMLLAADLGVQPEVVHRLLAAMENDTAPNAVFAANRAHSAYMADGQPYGDCYLTAAAERLVRAHIRPARIRPYTAGLTTRPAVEPVARRVQYTKLELHLETSREFTDETPPGRPDQRQRVEEITVRANRVIGEAWQITDLRLVGATLLDDGTDSGLSLNRVYYRPEETGVTRHLIDAPGWVINLVTAELDAL